MKRRSGFLLADAVVGLALLGIIAGMLAVALNRQQLALRRLADSRAACRLAENTLANLRSGRAAPHPAADTDTVRWRRIDLPRPPAGMVWVQVDATVNGRQNSLIGLVPSSSVEVSP